MLGLNLLGLREIEVKAEKDFVEILIEQKAVSIQVKLTREAVACKEFEVGGYKEDFSYSVKFSATTSIGTIVTFVKKSEQCLEPAGDTVYDTCNLERIIDKEKQLLNRIKESIPDMAIEWIIPRKDRFNNGGFENIIGKINN